MYKICSAPSPLEGFFQFIYFIESLVQFVRIRTTNGFIIAPHPIFPNGPQSDVIKLEDFINWNLQFYSSWIFSLLECRIPCSTIGIYNSITLGFLAY